LLVPKDIFSLFVMLILWLMIIVRPLKFFNLFIYVRDHSFSLNLRLYDLIVLGPWRWSDVFVAWRILIVRGDFKWLKRVLWVEKMLTRDLTGKLTVFTSCTPLLIHVFNWEFRVLCIQVVNVNLSLLLLKFIFRSKYKFISFLSSASYYVFIWLNLKWIFVPFSN
jgi:hypothetical protein